MTFVDLFAGLGGFHIAATQLGMQCVYAAEKDEYLRKLYQLNYGIIPEGDIRNISTTQIPAHDILFAGFPCQPFSKAGMQQGIACESDGTLFFEIAKILEYHKPKYFILENVPNLIRHRNGETWKQFESVLTSEPLGYYVSVAKLSPHQFGIPHVRERVFMVGSKYGLSHFEWPIPNTFGDTDIRNILDKKPRDATYLSERTIKILDIWQEFLRVIPENAEMPSFPIWSMEYDATYPFDKDTIYDYPMWLLRSSKGKYGSKLDHYFRKSMLPLLPSYARARNDAFPNWKKQFIHQNRQFLKENKKHIKTWSKKIQPYPESLQKFEWNCKGEERDIWKHIIQFRASGIRVRRSITSPSLVAMTNTQIPIIGWEKRYMTVRERARLQSMGQLKHMPEGNRAVSALGNAVNVEVVKSILKCLLK